MAQPQSRSKSDLAAFIREYIDPDGQIRTDDDPAFLVEQLNRVFADDGGCGVTVEEMAEYIESL